MPDDFSDSGSAAPETRELARQASQRRLRIALTCYLALGGLAWLTLDGQILGATLLILGLIAFKSWLGVIKDRQH